MKNKCQTRLQLSCSQYDDWKLETWRFRSRTHSFL